MTDLWSITLSIANTIRLDGKATLTGGLGGVKVAGSQVYAFEARDMSVTIDLGKVTPANFVSLGGLQDYNQWIFFPKWVKFERSADGKQFSLLATV